MSTQPSQSFRQRHRPSLLTALGVFGVLLIFRALIGGDDAAQLENAEPLLVTALAATELASYEVEQRFVGRIAARRESEVGFELSGAVAQMRVEEGDEVASGEVLAELDQALLLARQAELEAVVTQAQAQRDLAQQSSERTRGAFAQNAVSAQALDEAEASARVAVANAAAAQASAQAAAGATEVLREEGLIDGLPLLAAQRVQLAREQDLIVSETETAQALVGLYRVLGGGW